MGQLNENGVYIIDAKRMPFVPARGEKTPAIAGGDDRTRAPGVYQHLSSDYLLANAIGAILPRDIITHKDIADIIIGCVAQTKEQGANIARNAALLAGIPPEVPAQTVNRLCASSLEAAISAAREIKAGRDLVKGKENKTNTRTGKKRRG